MALRGSNLRHAHVARTSHSVMILQFSVGLCGRTYLTSTAPASFPQRIFGLVALNQSTTRPCGAFPNELLLHQPGEILLEGSCKDGV